MPELHEASYYIQLVLTVALAVLGFLRWHTSHTNNYTQLFVAVNRTIAHMITRTAALGHRRLGKFTLTSGNKAASTTSSTTDGTNSRFPNSEYIDGRYQSPWASPSPTVAQLGTFFRRTLYSNKPHKLTFPTLNGTPSHMTIKAVPVQRSKMFVKDKPHCTWIGHATVVYQTDGINFITDPVFSDACSPVPELGPFRVIPPSSEIEDLDIDVVLLSHTHYDHMDLQSLRRIGNRALWIVPLGVKTLLRAEGVTNCVELDWWQKHTIRCPGGSGKTVDIIFTPTKHWTARGLFDRNTCLWGSFAVLAPSSKFFFAGDTAYCDVFQTIGDTFGPFDLATIPIGAYKPRWFLKTVHCDPSEAIQIHKDLKAKQSCALHWGTFPLADEDLIEPPLELARARVEANVHVDSFYTMAHGETLLVGEKPGHDFAQKHPQLLETYLEYYGIESREVEIV